MIDEKLYRETFSRLQASDEAKKEVLLKMSEMNEKKTMKRPWKALRVLALAAMLTLALAVTANAASNGTLFENLRIIWQDENFIVLEDDSGGRVEVVGVFADAQIQDGKLILTVNEEKIDITEAIAESGFFSVTAKCADGSEAEVCVTGTLEDWEVRTSVDGSDVNYGVSVSAESSAEYEQTYTTTTITTS